MNRSERVGIPILALTLLALAVLALGGLIALEIDSVPETPDRPLHPTTAIQQPTPQPPSEVSDAETKSLLREILARPVFSPDRRPTAATARGAEGLNRLTGIVLSGSEKLAIFAAPAGGHPIIAVKGAHVGAYEVTDITSAGVTVVGPNGTTIVVPSFNPGAPTGPPTTARAATERRIPPK